MQPVINWIKLKKKWLLGLGAGYLALELLAALLVAFGILAIKG